MTDDSTQPSGNPDQLRTDMIREVRTAYDRCQTAERDRDSFARLIELRDATWGLLTLLERELPGEENTLRQQRAFAFD
ncbi:hypothetical protein I5L01_04415 [Erythrobacter sp. YJ-T3-07]|uniref:hypothetical protein n=1 Tax=Erythrobacter sp. YJ-T3-07 TaxID=2793063 RepID=UPI0018D3EE14|nr:hypothetical protein [Erythrobacter sp. YJ-T3-07]MBH1943472.1 hypothetical protein [Erythrobacter sp. YJ-T3-07]